MATERCSKCGSERYPLCGCWGLEELVTRREVDPKDTRIATLEKELEEAKRERLLYGSEQFALGRTDGQEDQKMVERLTPGSAAMFWHDKLRDFQAEWRGSKGILEAKISKAEFERDAALAQVTVLREALEKVWERVDSITPAWMGTKITKKEIRAAILGEKNSASNDASDHDVAERKR